MRLPKSIASLAAIAVCAFAVCNTHAQTNNVTFTATLTVQQPNVNTATSSTIALKSKVLNTTGLIAELARATSTNFSNTAKLAVISGSTNSQFAVVDGTNFVLIATNIMNLFQATTNVVVSGMENSKIEVLKELMIFELDFNDVGMGASDYQFSLRGLGGVTMTFTATSTTTSAKLSMLGSGTQRGTNLVATASLTGSGKVTQ
jgi:hypothetical protein